METNEPRQLTPAQNYGRTVESMAKRELERILGSEQGAKAAAQVALAFRATATANPTVYDCHPGSVASCVAMSALTNLMPGGPNPDVYLVPRRTKGVQQLNWMITHRGLAKLAVRAGYQVRARAVYRGEEFTFEEGDTLVVRHVPDLDGAHSYDDLRGVLVQVYRLSDNVRIAADFVNKATIERRKAQSDSAKSGSGPWASWPVEMALKTAIKYLFARGGVPMDDTATREALAADERDAIDTTATPVVEAPAKQLGYDALDAALTSQPVETVEAGEAK